MRLIFLLLIAALAFGQTPAADANSSPISTDRPAVTDSSVVVPAGTIQLENGFADTVSEGLRTLDGPETWMRIGVASKTELRVIAPDYFGPQGLGSGFGDLALGVKQQLGPVAGFDVSLVVMLSLPTGARGFTSHGFDPSVQLPWSRSLSTNWTVAGMLSVYTPTINGSHRVTGETTLLVDRQLIKPWDAFLEYAGDFPEYGGPRHLLHAGTAFKLSANQQIDFHVGVGLSSAAVDRLIGIGYSFRFAAFRH